MWIINTTILFYNIILALFLSFFFDIPSGSFLLFWCIICWLSLRWIIIGLIIGLFTLLYVTQVWGPFVNFILGSGSLLYIMANHLHSSSPPSLLTSLLPPLARVFLCRPWPPDPASYLSLSSSNLDSSCCIGHAQPLKGSVCTVLLLPHPMSYLLRLFKDTSPIIPCLSNKVPRLLWWVTWWFPAAKPRSTVCKKKKL